MDVSTRDCDLDAISESDWPVALSLSAGQTLNEKDGECSISSTSTIQYFLNGINGYQARKKVTTT
jgi:hypothetical protein